MSTNRTMKRLVDLAFVTDLGLPVEFPMTYFPGPIEQYRQDLMRQTTIPGEFAAAGMLAALSVGVGNSVVGRLGTKRFVPTSLYLLMIGNPGSGKSPALANTLEPIRREQAARVQAALQPAGACRQPQAADMLGGCFGSGAECDADYADDDDGLADDVRLSPVRHLHLTDATIPGVREALLNNPRGIVVAADEAVNLVKGAGKGCDRAVWLEMWNAESLAVSRRSGRTPILTIPRCFVTLVAGTQPDIFPQLRNKQGDDGLLDRLLIFGTKGHGWPRYSHCQTDAALAAVYNAAVDRLLQHRDDGTTATGLSAVLPMSSECGRVFEECHNHITATFDRVRASQRYGGLVTKLVANAARLAVLRACARWAVYSPTSVASPEEVTEADAIEACMVARFCRGRAIMWRDELIDSSPATVLGPPTAVPTSSLGAGTPAGPGSGLPDRVLDYMRRRSVRQVQVRQLQSSGSFHPAKANQLRAACDTLLEAGRGRWLDTRKGLFGLVGDAFDVEGGSR
jgi:hypothetical protein